MQPDPSQKVFKQLLVGSRMEKYMFPITREAPISGTCEKKSLLIESTLNNLTIPAFFLCEDENGNSMVILRSLMGSKD